MTLRKATPAALRNCYKIFTDGPLVPCKWCDWPASRRGV